MLRMDREVFCATVKMQLGTHIPYEVHDLRSIPLYLVAIFCSYASRGKANNDLNTGVPATYIGDLS